MQMRLRRRLMLAGAGQKRSCRLRCAAGTTLADPACLPLHLTLPLWQAAAPHMREAAKREIEADGRARPRCILNVSSVSGSCAAGSWLLPAACFCCLLDPSIQMCSVDWALLCLQPRPLAATTPCRRARQRGSGQLLHCQGGVGGPHQGSGQGMGPLWHPLQRAHIRLHQHAVRWRVGIWVPGRAWGELAGRAACMLARLAAAPLHPASCAPPPPTCMCVGGLCPLSGCCRLVQSKDKGAVIEVEGEQVKLGIPQVRLLPSGGHF